MPALSSNAPNFDISSVQVLKGPQGTLFRRNTLGGAVLITPALPSYAFGGYICALYGRFERLELEGATHNPLVDNSITFIVRGDWVWENPRHRHMRESAGV